MKKTTILAAALFGTTALAADLPPHAVAVDRWGTWTCQKGYLLQNRRCISEEEARTESQFVVSDVPSAGDGAPASEGIQEGSIAGAAPGASGAQSAASPVFIQTDQPWSVVLDANGNPSTVIVGTPASRPEHSALFGR